MVVNRATCSFGCFMADMAHKWRLGKGRRISAAYRQHIVDTRRHA